MAVSITAAELAAALRLGDSAEETAEATRLLAYATEAVGKHVKTAPDVVHNEAVRRVAGYLYDMPEAAVGMLTLMPYATVGRRGYSYPTEYIGPGTRTP